MSLSNSKLAAVLAGIVVLGLSQMASAQDQVRVQRADLAVPFGTAGGKLVLASEQLVFVDDDRTESSFAIARSDISDLKTENDMIVLTTKRPIRDRSGERTEFTFRLREGSAESIAKWAGARAALTSVPSGTLYDAKHPHKIALVSSGSCKGKLIIARDRVTYESLEDREHSRQWPLADIKKVKRNGPYQVEIEPFTGDKYTLEIEGQGVDIEVYKRLTDWMSLARAGGPRR